MTWKRRWIAWVMFASVVSLAVAASNDPHWARIYYDATGGVSLIGHEVARTNDGGIVVGCTANWSSPGSENMMIGLSTERVVILKLDQDGQIEWQQTLQSKFSQHSQLTSIQEIVGISGVQDGFVATGLTRGTTGNDAAFLLKLTSNGDLEWSRIYEAEYCHIVPSALYCDGASLFVAGAIRPTEDAHTVLTVGEIEELGIPETQDFWVLNLDLASDEPQHWQHAYDSDVMGDEMAVDMGRMGNDYLVAGNRVGYSNDRDIWVINLTGSGICTSTRKFGYPAQAQVCSIQATSANSYVLAGFTRTSSGVDYDAFALSFDDNLLDCTWLRSYDFPARRSEYAYSIATIPAGYMIGGSLAHFSNMTYGFALDLYASGGVRNAWLYGGAAGDHLYDLKAYAVEMPVEQNDFTMLLTGLTESFTPAQAGSMWVLSLDPNGNADPAFDDSCYKHYIDEIFVTELKWACNCQTDCISRSPVVEVIFDSYEKIEPLEIETLLLCDQLP